MQDNHHNLCHKSDVTWIYEKKNESEDADVCNVSVELLQYWRFKVLICSILE